MDEIRRDSGKYPNHHHFVVDILDRVIALGIALQDIQRSVGAQKSSKGLLDQANSGH